MPHCSLLQCFNKVIGQVHNVVLCLGRVFGWVVLVASCCCHAQAFVEVICKFPCWCAKTEVRAIAAASECFTSVLQLAGKMAPQSAASLLPPHLKLQYVDGSKCWIYSCANGSCFADVSLIALLMSAATNQPSFCQHSVRVCVQADCSKKLVAAKARCSSGWLCCGVGVWHVSGSAGFPCCRFPRLVFSGSTH